MSSAHDAAFDQHATSYDEQIERGLSLSGERKEYFAERRIDWMRSLLAGRGEPLPRTVLDYGCGIGTALPMLGDRLGAECVIGADVSARSLEQARLRLGAGPRIQLIQVPRETVSRPCDLAYTSGVFHHIAPADRPAALALVRDSLRPGGLFAFWEHNPWNPGTRLIVRRIPFDRDANLLSAAVARHLLRMAGFAPLLTHYLFLFPRALAPLRALEPPLVQWPLGAQYLVLARRN